MQAPCQLIRAAPVTLGYNPAPMSHRAIFNGSDAFITERDLPGKGSAHLWQLFSCKKKRLRINTELLSNLK